MGEIVKVKLPDIGEGIAEGEIVEWLVKEGDTVKQFQPVVKVLTAKATVEIPSPVTGVVKRLLAKPGDVVQVGEPIMEIEVSAPGEAKPEAPKKPAVEAAAAGAERPAAPAEARPEASPAPSAAAERPRALIRAPPRVRKLARQLGVDLALVKGTGPRGAITEDDVRRAAEELRAKLAPPKPAEAPAPAEARPAQQPAPPAPAAPAPARAEELEERVPLRGVRRIMAQTMSLSKSKIPHAYLIEEVDFTELARLRDSLKPLAQERGVKLTYLPFIIKAVVKALKAYPWLNASLDEERMELVVKKYYHIGIAVDTPHGLMVPVIRNADKLGLFALAREIARLAEKARRQDLSLEEATGATFTVTNVGSVGSVMGLPVIYPPNVAILGVHRIVERPMFVGDEIKPRKIVYLSLSFDHRAIEGAYAARFLMELKRLLENPALIFAADDEFK